MTLTLVGTPEIEQHAPGCGGQCPRWLAANAPTCMPYPCRCADTKASAPEWTQHDPKCWWKTKAGAVRSRCPCWGSDPAGRPGDCCAHHSANPRYVLDGVVLSVVDVDELPLPLADVDIDDSTPPDGVIWDTTWSAYDDWNRWPDQERKPFVRRWDPEDCTCDCELSYADDKRSVAVHCVTCHEDFANPGVEAVHRRSWSAPCRPPHTVIDVDTGEPLMYQDAAGLWRARYPSAA